MSLYNKWLNICVDDETLEKVKSFASRQQARIPRGTMISLSAAARWALVEGIKAIEVNHARENQKPLTDKKIQAEDC